MKDSLRNAGFDLMSELSGRGSEIPLVPPNGAIIDGPYRYLLWRRWDDTLPKVCWVMLNPSTADATEDDATIRKVVKFSQTWGFGEARVVNLFAYRATDPSELFIAAKGGVDVVGPYNDQHIMVAMHMCPKLTIAAWGAHGNVRGQAAHVMKFCRRALGGERVLHSLKVNTDGTPSHPLYLLDTSTPTPYPKD